MEEYTLSWGFCFFCFILLVGFYFALLILSRIVRRTNFFGEAQHRIDSALQFALKIYEPVALTILLVMVVLVNPIIHGLIALFFLVLGYMPIKNYISGQLFLLAHNLKKGQRVKIGESTGVIERMGRIGLYLQTAEGARFINYSSLLSDGYMMLKGAKIGGLHQLQIRPKEIGKVDHLAAIRNKLFSCPYIDWNLKPNVKKEADEGDDLYRRSLYTFIRRTSPPPFMSTFDVSPREKCIVKREQTNTPLQALILLNDPQFVEAARVLAVRMQKEGGANIVEQITYAFRVTTGRKPQEQEIALLTDLFEKEKARFQQTPKAAREVLKIGKHPLDKTVNRTTTAALSVVANTILNHDEAYMKR